MYIRIGYMEVEGAREGGGNYEMVEENFYQAENIWGNSIERRMVLKEIPHLMVQMR